MHVDIGRETWYMLCYVNACMPCLAPCMHICIYINASMFRQCMHSNKAKCYVLQAQKCMVSQHTCHATNAGHAATKSMAAGNF